MSRKLIYYLLGVAIIFASGFYAGTQDYTTKVVQKDKSKSKQDIKVVEKIVEKPGGERIIYRTRTEKRENRNNKTVTKTVKSKKWLVGLSRSVYGYSTPGPTHTLSVYKKTLGGLYVGAWGTTNSEYGVGLIYSF